MGLLPFASVRSLSEGPKSLVYWIPLLRFP